MNAFEGLRLDIKRKVTLDELISNITEAVAGMLKFYHTSDPKKVGDVILNPDHDNDNGEDWYYELMIRTGLLEPLGPAMGKITPKFQKVYKDLLEEGYYKRREEEFHKRMAGT